MLNVLKSFALITILAHSIDKNHAEVTVNDFKLIGRTYRNNVQKRKVAEALLNKQF